jgi:hypothetical protein
MKNFKILSCILGAMLLVAVTGCKKDDSSPKADMEDGLTGYWFKLSSSSMNLINDVDGYMWGVKIEENGNVTVVRWDNSVGEIAPDADGEVFTISKAQSGAFSGSDGENELSGTYSLSTTVLSELTYSSMYFYSSMLSGEYLPGGYAGDWSVNGYYAKIFNLDKSYAEIQ